MHGSFRKIGHRCTMSIVQTHRRKRKVRNLNYTLMEIVQETTPEKTVRVHESDKPWMTG